MEPEYRHALSDCTAFERDLLAAVAHRGPANGIQIKEEFAKVREDRVWNAHYYEKLDGLVTRGYVNKDPVSDSENEYSVTEGGREALHRYAEWLVDPPVR